MKRTTTFRSLCHTSGVLLLTSVVWLSGCVKGTLLDPDVPSTKGTIRIGSTIEASTKAPQLDTEWQIGVYFLRQDVSGGSAPGNYSGLSPFRGHRGPDGHIEFDSEQLYALNDDNAFFVAYWPQGTQATGTKTSWTIDGRTDILISDEYDAGKSSLPLTGAGGADGVPMIFRHRLAQLNVICKADPDMDYNSTIAYWGIITKIELLETFRTAIYTYATNAVTFTDAADAMPLLKSNYEDTFAPISIPAKDNTTVNAAAMLSPSTSNTVKLRVTTANQGSITVTVPFPSGGTFEQGKRHTIPLVFKSDGGGIEVGSSTITAWSTGYNGTTDETIKPEKP